MSSPTFSPFSFFSQQKLLILNPDFFLTFEEFTEPLKNGIVEKLSKEIKHPLDVSDLIKNNFRKKDVKLRLIWKVKYMEENKVVGGCTEYALLTAAILRRAGYPTAILDCINVKDLYKEKERAQHSMHTANLVLYDDSWFLLDIINKTFTRKITLTLIKKDLLPLAIHRGYSDLKIKDKLDKFMLLLNKTKQILPLVLERDLLYPEYQNLLRKS